MHGHDIIKIHGRFEHILSPLSERIHYHSPNVEFSQFYLNTLYVFRRHFCHSPIPKTNNLVVLPLVKIQRPFVIQTSLKLILKETYYVSNPLTLNANEPLLSFVPVLIDRGGVMQILKLRYLGSR